MIFLLTKIVSWNVNGVKSCLSKGLLDFMKNEKADAYCFQEIKISAKNAGKLPVLPGYEKYCFPAEKNGYSGLLVYSRAKPSSVAAGIGLPEFDKEARALTLEFKDFFLVNAYFPHTNRELTRLDFKLAFNLAFEAYCDGLRNKKPVVVAADFNVAHQEIDLANPRENEGNAGFTREEREWFDSFLKKGYVDSFRLFEKENGHYSWWAWRSDCRARNIGWRIDYFVVDAKLKDKVRKSVILDKVHGSDHCPIALEIDL